MRLLSIARLMLYIPTRIFNAIKFQFQRVRVGKSYEIIGKVHIVNRGTISIGDNCRIVGNNGLNPIGFVAISNIIAEKSAVICIGNRLGMSNSTIYARKKITIGNNVIIGGGTKIYDTDFHSLNHIDRNSNCDKKNSINKSVFIGNDVFIGAGSTILKGVSIGDRSIIGANSVVTKNVPADEIWTGNPARFIRKV